MGYTANLKTKYGQALLATYISTLREESSQTNVILQASTMTVELHFYYTLYDGKYDCKITKH